LATIIDAITTFVNQIGLGLLPLPPEPNSIGSHNPDFSSLGRDAGGIIGQLQDDGSLDGGDSAHRTGVTAFCNSAQDAALLPRFESGGVMVRHPIQAPWNNWKNCSRDQLTGFSAGCWRTGHLDVAQRLLKAHAARIPPFTCQNTENDWPGTTKNPPVGDLLMPHDLMFLRISAGENAAYLDMIAQFTLQVAIETTDPNVKTEKNQLILESILCGRLNLFTRVHPNYEDSLRAYWSGWRKQPQIAEELIWVIKEELKRYGSQLTPTLLPFELINLLRGLDLRAELSSLDPAHYAHLAARFAEAALRDAANHFVFTLQLGLNVVVQELNKLNATVDQISRALADLNQAPNAIRSALETFGFPANAISRAMQAAFPGIPHVDSDVIPHVDDPSHHDAPPLHSDISTNHADSTTGHGDTSSGHQDAGPIHFDVGPSHGDTGGSHADGGPTHSDGDATPHFDSGHIDTPSTAHVDTP
jgi:hypothetical protein